MNDMNQSPQPTKATLTDLNPIPEENNSQEFHDFSKEFDVLSPSSPPMALPSYELHHDQVSDHLEPPPKCYPQLEKPLMKSSLSKRHYSPSTGKTPRGEKEAVSELVKILVDCMEELNTKSRETLLRKFFSEIERDERLEELERFKVRTLELGGTGPAEEVGKLERFRVKTLEFGGTGQAQEDGKN
ncbi:hypothetical protein Vadar_023972 [Vaccinium darrowii]|uniref:Uncharacterized protein n=1 Tax=Vaccinium darrowii TaxID=229202 RepID=A0ACB7YNY9_9ERIC|nr:hypothetical protein Vadar_023972 [Vaccinium darrowii]